MMEILGYKISKTITDEDILSDEVIKQIADQINKGNDKLYVHIENKSDE